MAIFFHVMHDELSERGTTHGLPQSISSGETRETTNAYLILKQVNGLHSHAVKNNSKTIQLKKS